jgi:hypothetical protein
VHASAVSYVHLRIVIGLASIIIPGLSTPPIRSLHHSLAVLLLVTAAPSPFLPQLNVQFNISSTFYHYTPA